MVSTVVALALQSLFWPQADRYPKPMQRAVDAFVRRNAQIPQPVVVTPPRFKMRPSPQSPLVKPSARKCSIPLLDALKGRPVAHAMSMPVLPGQAVEKRLPEVQFPAPPCRDWNR
jgi:hypothetical protein